ncbi:MAG: membrane protein insertase YidC [Bacteroidetes bacterium HGW-Bacteroidetes-21]|nr:MAG: membrane protein insertase YidC [Bacteroidetes bacterium HGW-Bacteroidetes-21]
MDKNTIFGLVIILGIIVVFSVVNQPSKEEIEQAKKKMDSIALVENTRLQEEAKQQAEAENKVPIIGPNDSTDVASTDSLKQNALVSQFGRFSNNTEGQEKFSSLENDKIRILFTNKGGRIFSVQLKEYQTFDSLPLILFSGDSTLFEINFFSDNRNISTQNLFFEMLGKDSALVADKDSQTVAFQLSPDSLSSIIFEYSLKPGSYKVDFNIKTKGIEHIIAENANYLNLNWHIKVPAQEKGMDFERQNSTIYFKHHQDEVDYLSTTSDDKKNIPTKIDWIGFKQQFFSSVIIPQEPFLNGVLTSEKYPGTERFLKNYTAELSIPIDTKKDETKAFQFYFGPNHFNTLQEQNVANLEELIPLGWGIFGWFNRYLVIPIFNFLDNFIGSYGIIILLLTLIIKILLLPLTYKSYISTAKMKVLKPQIEEINAKIPKDKAMERQQATMALYKKVGVSPLGGCLPMLLQMPILFAMFRFFPASIELRQKSFLWATDLSSYDSVLDLSFNIPFYGNHVSLFCLLMTISTIIYTWQQSQTQATPAMPGMKVMMYMMPVMFLFFFNNYASGLSYYYLLANLITFGQMYIFRKVVNDEALLEKLNENKKKVVKKSSFQERLEKMAKNKGYKR